MTDPKLATYGSSNFILAITQLAQTTLRSVVGKLELDKTFEERDMINHAVVSALDQAAMNWGVKVLRYEIRTHAAEGNPARHAGPDHGGARERALIARLGRPQAGTDQHRDGPERAAIAKSEGDKFPTSTRHRVKRPPFWPRRKQCRAIRKIAMAIGSDGGLQAVNLKVAEQYVAALSNIARTGNTIVVPQNLTDIAGLVTTATSVLKAQPK